MCVSNLSARTERVYDVMTNVLLFSFILSLTSLLVLVHLCRSHTPLDQISSFFVSMATPKRKRAVLDNSDSPLPTATKRKVLMSQEEQADGDIQSDSDSSGSEAVSTSSDSEADTNSDFMDLDAPELRSICNGVPEAVSKEVDTILRQQHPWIEGADSSSRGDLRIILFQRLVKLCGWLDQKYSLASPKSYVCIIGLFDANPQLVSDIDACWSNPKGSFSHIGNLGKYFRDNPHLIHSPMYPAYSHIQRFYKLPAMGHHSPNSHLTPTIRFAVGFTFTP